MTAATTAPAVAQPARRPASRPWLLLVPSALFLLLLLGWPLVVGTVEAFRGPDGLSLDNLRRMAADSFFRDAVRNTLMLAAVVVPLQFALATAMAMVLRGRPRFSGAYLYLWSFPLAVSDLAAGLVWLSIFTDRGYLNSVLAHLGISEGVAWLDYDRPGRVLAVIVVAEIWRSTALVLVILVAGLQSLPRDYDEAAAVFGASRWRTFREVTLPLLTPSIKTALVLRTILAFETFAVAQALAGRDFPLLVGETYQWYVKLQDAGVASAIALVVLLLSLATSFLYLRTLRTDDTSSGAEGVR